MDLRLGKTLTNQKGGKFLPAEPPLRWNTTQWAEILYEPSSFGKGESERVSLVLELTAEMEKTVERLEKQASSLVAGRKLEAQLQSSVQQTRSGQSLKLKANMSKVRFWDADGNKLASPPAEAQRSQGAGRGRAAAAVDHGANVRPSHGGPRHEGRLLTASLEIFRRFCETAPSPN